MKSILEKYNTPFARHGIVILISLIFASQQLDFYFSEYVPMIFFTIGMSVFTLRITISTSFTDKLPAKTYIMNNLKLFNNCLTSFIYQTFAFGIISVVLFPIYKLILETNKKPHLTQFEIMTHYVTYFFVLYVFLYFLIVIFIKMLHISRIINDLINEYVTEIITKKQIAKKDDVVLVKLVPRDKL